MGVNKSMRACKTNRVCDTFLKYVQKMYVLCFDLATQHETRKLTFFEERINSWYYECHMTMKRSRYKG